MTMSKRKVLHVSYGGLGSGGVATVIHSISEPLKDYFDFHCIVFRKKGNTEGRFLKYGKIHRINCYGFTGVRKVLDIILRPFIMTIGSYKICKNEKIDIIHCHNGYEEAYFLLGAKLAGVKNRIAHSHNTHSPIPLSFSKKWSNFCHRYLINNLATQKIGCSQQACDDFFHSTDTCVIYNSIDLNKFKWRRIPHEGLCFVNVGRYCYQKNQSFVIDIFKEILKSYSNAVLKLVGFGESEESLKNKVHVLGLEKSIFFIDGTTANIPSVYAEADAMIFPSTFEGFGIVLIEAQATGCYVFASDVVPKATNIGLMTRLSLNNSEKDWAQIICDNLRKIGNVRYENIHERLSQFDINTISRQYKTIYDK